jgi:polysaccharide pyruvyl transferase WcaK-like protein
MTADHNLDSVVAYSGWIGHRNVGDEALYRASNKIFNQKELVDISNTKNFDHLLLGGGTVLPKYVYKNQEANPDGLKIALGVGVRDPEFWNQRFSRVDIGRLLGKVGYGGVIDNKYINHINDLNYLMLNDICIANHYISTKQFEILKNFEFDYLGVRGPRSQAILAEHGIDSQIIGDTALFLEPQEYSDETTHRVMVTLRQGGPKWSDDNEYIKTVIKFCQNHSDEYEFVFVPFQPTDIELNMNAAARVPNSQFKDYCTQVDVISILDEIAQYDLVIADRLHANILSACAHTHRLYH